MVLTDSFLLTRAVSAEDNVRNTKHGSEMQKWIAIPFRAGIAVPYTPTLRSEAPPWLAGSRSTIMMSLRLRVTTHGWEEHFVTATRGIARD